MNPRRAGGDFLSSGYKFLLHSMVRVMISYWNQKDGRQLYTDVRKVFESPGGKERYWDQVPLEFCAANYNVEVRPCTFDDIIEIDTFGELKKLDKTYDV